MYFKKNKSIIIGCALVVLLILTGIVINLFWPRYEEQFFELSLLGKNKMAENFFLNDNSSLLLNSQVAWFIYIYNHIGSPQNVFLKVKLVNSTIDLPIDQDNKPSLVDPIAEFPLSLSINETLLVPFSWSIVEAFSQNDSIILKQLIINDEIVNVNISTSSNSSCWMVFELWVYDNSSQNYRFGWLSGEKLSSSSLYMLFKVLPIN